jgi:F0F1-type ATP synthase membrane subunit b/b'
MDILRRSKKAAKVDDPKARSKQASAKLSAGLEKVDKLLDQSDTLSKGAKQNLEDFEEGITAIGTKAPSGDHLNDVDKLLGDSERLSGNAKANLDDVKADIAEISHEAEVRKHLGKRG